MKQYKIYLKNFAINIFESGAGQHAIIFIHGNSMSSNIWKKQLASETLAGYRLLAMDLPGHGDSSHSTDPDANYNVLFYGELLAELIKELHVENVILVGHSLGANAVIEALPLIKNCKGCLLLSASLVHSVADLAITFLPNPAASIFFSADYTEENIQEFNDAVKALTTISLPDFIKDDFRKTDKNCRSYLAKSVGENKLSDELDILQKAEMSILLVIGAEDQLINKEYLKSVALSKWGNQVFEIPKAGHCAQFENADDFNALIDSFCQTCL